MGSLKSLFEDKMFDTFHNGYSQRILGCLVILFVVSFSISLGGSAYAANNLLIITDYPTWYYTDHGALVNVTYTDPNGNQPPTVSVKVASQTDQTGCTLTFQQSYSSRTNYILQGSTNPAYDIQVYLMFTTATKSSNCNVPQLAVDPNADTITITATTNNGATASKTVTTKNSDDNVSWTVKTTDQPYKKVILPPGGCIGQTSGDGICDEWKNQDAHSGYIQIPYTDPAGNNLVYNWGCNTKTNTNLLQDECPKVGEKDIYVEADWFLRHHPDVNMIPALKAAFKSANIKNADGTRGINLHIILDEEIPSHKDQITAPSPGAPLTATSDFDILKTIYFGSPTERNENSLGSNVNPSVCKDPFGNTITSASSSSLKSQCVTDILTAKRQVFHYAIFAHSQAGGYSGSSELPGNDMMISLGGFTGGVGSLDQLEGTFMHELGHNLNLYHGGSSPPDPLNPDYDNCKPNYLSVMNYNFQFSDFIWNRALNYSGGTNVQLDKNNLNENYGVYRNDVRQPTPPPNTVYGTPNSSPYFTITPVGSSWGTYGTDFDGKNDGIQTSTPANINNISFYKSSCNVPNVTTNQLLNDFNDWNNLLYDMKTSSAFYDGVPITAIEGVAVDAKGATIVSKDDDHGKTTGDLKIPTPSVPKHTGIDTKVEKHNPINFIPEKDAERLAHATGGNLDILLGLYENPTGFIEEKGISIDDVRSIRAQRVLSIQLNVTGIPTFSITNSSSKTMAIQDLENAYNFTQQDALYPALLQLHDARAKLSYSISNVNGTKTKTLALLDDVVKSLEIALQPVKSYPDASTLYSAHHHFPITYFPYGQINSGVPLLKVTCDASSGYTLVIHARGSGYLPNCIKTSDVPQFMARSTSWMTPQSYSSISVTHSPTVALGTP